MQDNNYAQFWVFGQNSENQLGLGNLLFEEENPNTCYWEEFTDLKVLDNPRERKAQFYHSFFRHTIVYGASIGTHHTVFLVQEKCKKETHNREGYTKMVYSCGASNKGQTGCGTSNKIATPELVPVFYYNAYRYEPFYITSGAKHSLAITRIVGVPPDHPSQMWGWGAGMAGKLGLGDELNYYAPKMSNDPYSFISVSGGATSSAGISKEGILYTWGSNYYGECGTNKPQEGNYSTPQKIHFHLFPAVKFVQVCIGAAHAIALASNGSMYGTGSNSVGQVGIGSYESKIFNFTKIPLKNVSITDIACGLHFSVALSNKGAVYTWGRATRGRLGYRTNSNQHSPKMVPNLPAIRSIACTDHSTLVITQEGGRVYSWGVNKVSQLGFNPPEEQLKSEELEPYEELPVLLQHLRGVKQVNSPGSSGGRHVIAVISGAMEILHQHIRDINLNEIQYFLTERYPRNQLEELLLKYDYEHNNAITLAAKYGFHMFFNCLSTQLFPSALRINPIIQRLVSYSKDNDGKSALHICSQRGFNTCVDFLLSNGADPYDNTDNLGRTPLHYALIHSHKEIAHKLIKYTRDSSLLSIKDEEWKTPLEYLDFRDCFEFKMLCPHFIDVFVINSAKQNLVVKTIISHLKHSSIKVGSDPIGENENAEVYSKISRSHGIIFIIGNETVDNTVARKYLEFARKHKKQIYPIWESNPFSLPADFEAIIFRYQVLNISTNTEEMVGDLGNSIRYNIMNSDDMNGALNIGNDGIRLRSSVSDLFGTDEATESDFVINTNSKLLYILYDGSDAPYAKTIIEQIQDKTSYLECFDGYNCSDKGLISKIARSCHAVIILLSKFSISSSYIRDQMNVAENNRKPIYSIVIDNVELPLDFTYTLAITPKFMYHPNTIVQQLLCEFKLVESVDTKIEQYNAVLQRTKYHN